MFAAALGTPGSDAAFFFSTRVPCGISFFPQATMTLTPTLTWLAYITLVTAMMWLPYTLALIVYSGLGAAVGNRDVPPRRPPPAWAARAKRAHANAVENLIVFAPLVLIAAFSHVGASTARVCTEFYFFARLVHYIVYCAGIPVVRTLAFFVGWVATVVLGVALLSSGSA